jgi:hypothetical protein
LKGPECKNGIRYGDVRQQLRGKIGIKDPSTRRQLRLRIKKTSDEIFRGEIAKQVVGTSELRRMKKWTLWRGRHPPKRKKKILHGVRARYVGAPATPGVIAPTVEREKERETTHQNFGLLS